MFEEGVSWDSLAGLFIGLLKLSVEKGMNSSDDRYVCGYDALIDVLALRT